MKQQEKIKRNTKEGEEQEEINGRKSKRKETILDKTFDLCRVYSDSITVTLVVVT